MILKINNLNGWCCNFVMQIMFTPARWIFKNKKTSISDWTPDWYFNRKYSCPIEGITYPMYKSSRDIDIEVIMKVKENFRRKYDMFISYKITVSITLPQWKWNKDSYYILSITWISKSGIQRFMINNCKQNRSLKHFPVGRISSGL